MLEEEKVLCFVCTDPACLTPKRSLHIVQLMLYRSCPLSCTEGMYCA